MSNSNIEHFCNKLWTKQHHKQNNFSPVHKNLLSIIPTAVQHIQTVAVFITMTTIESPSLPLQNRPSVTALPSNVHFIPGSVQTNLHPAPRIISIPMSLARPRHGRWYENDKQAKPGRNDGASKISRNDKNILFIRNNFPKRFSNRTRTLPLSLWVFVQEPQIFMGGKNYTLFDSKQKKEFCLNQDYRIGRSKHFY